MKISSTHLSRLFLAALAFALTCSSARAWQSAAATATQSSAAGNPTTAPADNSVNKPVHDAKPAPTNADHAIAKMIPVQGIPKFGEVSPQLLRGGQPSSEGLDFLAKMGVGIIVNLRPGEHPEEAAQANKLGMQYIAIPWHCYHPNDAAMAAFLTLIHENPDKKIFVHCELGTDRTGMSVAAYRMSAQGWSAEEAMKEMQAFGFSSSHHVTCRGLAGYEESFPSAFKTGEAFQKLRPPNPVDVPAAVTPQ
jgi:protein tyrosine phosphatase (PTP) superfamily phosphohydrolase (DUF442 family)